MRPRRKTALAAVIFTILVLAAVNAGWWWYYRSITDFLERQLSQRLTGVAATAALHITDDDIEGLLLDDLDVFSEQVLYLDSLTRLDSLSEASIIDLDFNYLASSREDIAGEGYLLARLNFDSLQASVGGRPAASRLYNIDGTYLKSAYAPLFGIDGEVAAVFVVEAGAGYFDLLSTLRRNLVFLAGGSAGIVLLLLIFYIIYSRRLAAAEEQLFRAGSQAALGRMVAVVSHEIKNPMMIIRAAGERIAKKYDDPEAGFVVEETSRLDQIVSGYLSFARGDAGLRLDVVDIGEVCRKIVSDFAPRFAESGVTVEASIADDLPPVRADRIGLRQVIINLLLNGLQAVTEDDGKTAGGKISLDARSSNDNGGSVVISVADTGPGIKPSQREKLFEPFYTTKTQGSGLGLYLARRIIGQHKGTIRITEDKNKMTAFVITLPTGEDR